MSSRASAAVVVLLSLLVGSHSTVLAQTMASGGSPGQQANAGTVFGTVYDSVARAPLVRAVVQMRSETGTDIYTATTDSTGHYELRDVTPGVYLATFFHPALDAMALDPLLHRVQVGEGVATELDFAVPSPATVWAVTCQPSEASDSTGLLLGHVRNADTGVPVVGGQVTVRWTELLLDPVSGLKTMPRQVTAETDEAGMYAVCGVPGDGSIGVQAMHGAALSGMIALDVPARGVLQTDLAVSSANSRVALTADSVGLDSGMVLVRGTAKLAGTVRSPTGQPMGDVELRVLGTGIRGRTATDGTFLLTGLPAGTQMLATRRLGLAPERMVVNLANGRTARVDVRVHEAVVLSRQTIYGKARSNHLMERLAGFLHRKRAGWGRFLTREDIQRRQPFNTTDLFQAMLGVRVRHGGLNPFVSTVRMRGVMGGWCHPNVYLDETLISRNLNVGAGGVPMPGIDGGGGASGDESIDDWVNPDDIAGIEVYPSMMQAPAQFRGVNCGSIVIWSRYAFPEVSTEQ